MADAAVSAIILDAQNMALSIQLVAKETLASRWQVFIVVMAQTFGLGIVYTIILRFNGGVFAMDKCRCLTVFWWAWLGNCLPSGWSSEKDVFWTYYALQFLSVVIMAFHSIWNTPWFDLAEKEGREIAGEGEELGGTLEYITYPFFGKHGPARYGEHPATVLFMYIFYTLLALTSLVVAETTMRDLHLRPTSTTDSTGQVIALVIAVATIVRALWLFFYPFKNSKATSFVWPFELRLFKFASSGTYFFATDFFGSDFIASDYLHKPNSLKLGSILRSPTDPDSKFGSHISPDHVLISSPPEEDEICQCKLDPGFRRYFPRSTSILSHPCVQRA
jgi:hypothetical protein